MRSLSSDGEGGPSHGPGAPDREGRRARRRPGGAGYAKKAANLTRGEEERRARQSAADKAAEQIVDVLGQMKGAAMKVGQVASFIDIGGLPPEFRERVQAKLAELRDSAPRVPFKECAR